MTHMPQSNRANAAEVLRLNYQTLQSSARHLAVHMTSGACDNAELPVRALVRADIAALKPQDCGSPFSCTSSVELAVLRQRCKTQPS